MVWKNHRLSLKQIFEIFGSIDKSILSLVQAKEGVAQMNVMLYQPMKSVFAQKIPIADIRQHVMVVKPVAHGKSTKETQCHAMVVAR